MLTSECVGLTLGFLALARRSPADAGTVFIQIEEPDQTFGAVLQLHHLSPRLHHTHASLNCENKTNIHKHIEWVDGHLNREVKMNKDIKMDSVSKNKEQFIIG